MAELPDLSRTEGFDWDQGNTEKSWKKHRVAFYESEEVFFYDPVLFPNPGHSVGEERYYAMGRTARGRLLTISFTIRRNKIRVVSARDMNRKERRQYNGKIKENS